MGSRFHFNPTESWHPLENHSYTINTSIPQISLARHGKCKRKDPGRVCTSIRLKQSLSLYIIGRKRPLSIMLPIRMHAGKNRKVYKG